jgi:hypothetical protein
MTSGMSDDRVIANAAHARAAAAMINREKKELQIVIRIT